MGTLIGDKTLSQRKKVLATGFRSHVAWEVMGSRVGKGREFDIRQDPLRKL